VSINHARSSAVHEVGLMQSALELAEAEAARRGATRIHRLTLRVGVLAGVEPDALAFAFDVASVGTPAEGAEFAIEDVQVVCHCGACDRNFYPSGAVFRCPACGELSAEVWAGRELELASLEVS
jgi:hydrogenase nickel incorporation protein HypA/HybF